MLNVLWGRLQKKLTEDELTARMESIKLKNAALEEAHRRAEADEASFQQREKQEAVKRQEERANRREMDSERERNRQRKIKASHGREWDAEKPEEEQPVGTRDGRGAGGGGNRSRYRKSLHGNVQGREQAGDSKEEDGKGGVLPPRGARGRGGRSNSGGRGSEGMNNGKRGRGGRNRGGGAGRGSSEGVVNASTVEGEFPALPSTKKDDSTVKEGAVQGETSTAKGGETQAAAGGKPLKESEAAMDSTPSHPQAESDANGVNMKTSDGATQEQDGTTEKHQEATGGGEMEKEEGTGPKESWAEQVEAGQGERKVFTIATADEMGSPYLSPASKIVRR